MRTSARLNFLIVFQSAKGLSTFQSCLHLNRRHRSLCAAAILAFPASVFGPVETPPWYLHRRLPGMTLFLQAAPDLARAPHCGRFLGGRGRPSSFSPFCCMRAQTTPVHSSHTFLKSGCRCAVAGQVFQRKRLASISSISKRRSAANTALNAACSLVGLPIENVTFCQQVCNTPYNTWRFNLPRAPFQSQTRHGARHDNGNLNIGSCHRFRPLSTTIGGSAHLCAAQIPFYQVRARPKGRADPEGV